MRLSTVVVACALVYAVPTLAEAKSYVGNASYYKSGKRTASGEQYNRNALTAAHRRWPFGTRVRITNRRNGRSVIVRINDRGPFKRGRLIDVSYAAAKALGMTKRGVASVRIEIVIPERKVAALPIPLPPPRPNVVFEQEQHEEPEDAFAAALPYYPSVLPTGGEALFEDVSANLNPFAIVGNIFRSFVDSLIRPAGAHVRMQCEDGRPFPDPLRRVLARAGEIFHATVYILSGYRPLSYNRRIYGNRRGRNGRYKGDGSQHILCRAADLRVAGVSAATLHAWARKQPEIGGLGRYRGEFIHVDIRPRPHGRLVMWDWRGKSGRRR